MAVISIFVFGATLAFCAWTLWATLAPQYARIVDLLANGPHALPVMPAPVPARSNLRNVSVRRMASPVSRRAAA